MLNEEKQQIAEKLKNYVKQFNSQNEAANSLTDVSPATVSQMINGKWDLIKEDMFRVVKSQIGVKKRPWVIAETTDFKLMYKLLGMAQEDSEVFAITGEAGSGKTEAIDQFCKYNKTAYHIKCSEFWNRKYFLGELLNAMGRSYNGMTVAEMMNETVRQLKRKHDPVIVLDEADKLNDQVLYFFITLYNTLEDHCGLVLCATDHLEKRIDKGVRLNRKGYNEIYSRIRRKFSELKGVSLPDVIQICKANGVESNAEIKRIFRDSENDLRRVKREVYKYHKKNQNGNQNAA